MAEEVVVGPSPDGSSRRRRRALVLAAGIVGIVLWQYVFFRHAYPETTLESSYKFEASSGVLLWQPEFVYFLYYLNLYPVATIAAGPLEYSAEGARRLIATQGQTLVMDRYWTIRYGDLAKTYLYLPHVWLKGKPVKPRMTHANAIAFTLALVSLFAAFWSAERTLLGTLLVVLIGSNPFQVHQVYANNNLFSWPISVTVLVLALHIPLMRERVPRAATAVAIALLSGLVLGSVRQIRTEPVLVLLSAAGVYLTASRLRLWLRLALVLILAVTFSWTARAWNDYFEGKYREAYQVVKAAGGHTYEGPRHRYHFFWHALWCGLGDFDDKYGYQWSDLSSFRYAWPVMQRRGVKMDGFEPPQPDPWDSLTLGTYWDRAGQYARTPQELREYIAVVREKVLYDVLHDPAWYASILARRVGRFLLSGTAPSLALGNGWHVSLDGPIPWTLLAMLLGVWLLARRDWFHLKLLVFTLPLAATAIAVYSGGGTVYYSIVHLVAVAIVCAAAWGRVRSGPLELPSLAGRLHLPALRWRGRRAGLAAALVLLLAALGLGTSWLTGVAGRAVAGAPAGRAGEPRVAVMRFENQTRSDELAWVGDAVGDRFAAGLAGSGVPLLDPEAVAWLDADLVVWTPSAILNGTLARAVNIVADRAGVEQIVAGRVLQDSGGPLACVAVFAPRGGAATSAERCERVDIGHPYEAADRLADVVRSVLGGGAARNASADVAGKAVKSYAEGRQSIQKQMWGKAARQLDRASRADARLQAARRLGARVSSRWQPLAPEVLRSLSGADRPREAIDALRSEMARDPTSVGARLDLGRLLIELEMFDDAVAVLNPLRYRPGSPAEAFGLEAEALSSLGELGRGYQVLLEGRRRSWQEPTGNTLLGEHLTRWGYFELATTYFDEAKGERPGQGMAPLIVDELLARWSIHALQRDWIECQKLATTLTTLDDPRAKGLGNSRLALGYLAAGRSRLAGAFAEEAVRELAEERVDTAEALDTAVQVRIEGNDAVGALGLIEGLQPTAVGAWRERALFWEAMALAHERRWAEAEAVRGRLARDLSDLPGPTGRRLLLHLGGEMAILRGEAAGAVASLSRAVELLPARGFCGDHVPLWYALGRAQLAAGRQDLALPWLERIATASNERLCWPIPYARSFLLLGRIHASSGQPGEAADAYRRFLDLWGEADTATAERSEAQRFLDARQKEKLAKSTSVGTDSGG